MVLASEIENLIARLKAENTDLRLNGTSRMSKTGVKWCLSANRDRLKRLRVYLKDVKRGEVINYPLY